MEALDYRELVRKIIQQHASEKSEDADLSAHIVFDEKRDRYLLMYVGWRGEDRFHGCPIHIEIQDEKFGFSKILQKRDSRIN